MKLVNLACISILAGGCGDYVRFEKMMPGGSNVGTLDEETKMRLANADHLEHLALESVLAAHVVTSTGGVYVYFDYAAMAADTEADLLLDQYLATLDAVSPDKLKDGDERLAYWVNGYNAAVIRGVLDTWNNNPAYSVSEGGFIFFDLEAYRLGGKTFSLNQIEHGIVRGDETHPSFRAAEDARKAELLALHASLWNGAPVDARIHIALNCASRSCPNLLAAAPHVFRAATIDEQLDRATREFCESAKGAGPDGVSQIFNWFAKDFEPVYGNAAGFIRMHRAMGLTGVNLDRFMIYDWSLNIVP